MYGTQDAQNADGAFIKKGEIMSVTFIPDDLGGEERSGEEELVIEVTEQIKMEIRMMFLDR